MQVEIPYELITSLGTLAFNGGTAPYTRIEAVEGLDFPTLRTHIDPRAGTDGDILSAGFRGGRYVTLGGSFVAATVANRDTLADTLRSHLNRIVRADATLRWQRRDGGGTWRRITVRLWEPPQITPEGGRGSWQFVVVAPDPYVYNDTEETHSDTTPLTSSNVTNDGDAESWPKVRIYGVTPGTVPTGFTIRNNTDGRLIRIDGLPTTDLDSTSKYVELDMANRTVKNSAGVNRIDKVNLGASDFWPLLPGVNAHFMDSIAPGGATTPSKFEVIYRDAWIGG